MYLVCSKMHVKVDCLPFKLLCLCHGIKKEKKKEYETKVSLT